MTLEHFDGMILVARSIGDDVTIRQNTTFGGCNKADLNGKPVIGDCVDIGVGAVIGANSVVLKDVPAGALAVGAYYRALDQNAKIALCGHVIFHWRHTVGHRPTSRNAHREIAGTPASLP